MDRLAVDRTAPVVVACSGGADSSALGHAALVLASAQRLGPVTLCYVDHQLRAGSAADGRVAERLAAAGGGRFVSLTVEVRRRGSLEEAAREARYAALERVASEGGAGAVLLGHTADDQAETVLMRIVAGTGLAGLSGMPARRGRFVRPLLEVRRADTVAYCRRHSIEFVEDPTNVDPRHTRNRVRHEILPLLRGENPRVEAALVELARRAGEIEEVVGAAAEELVRAAREGDGLSVAVLAAAPRMVAARALARAAEAAGAGPLSARHLAALDALLRRAAGGSAGVDLPGLRAVREYDRLIFAAPGDAADPSPLAVSGPDGPYEVRAVRPGDRMRPARLRGRSRKLSDLFVDARVPRRLRARARVVVRCSDGTIEWAEHLGPAHGSAVAVTLTGQGGLATNKSR
jgi:tRNA(Ile)-lysidine synthase